jgi:hypothetical protein
MKIRGWALVNYKGQVHRLFETKKDAIYWRRASNLMSKFKLKIVKLEGEVK